MKKLLFALLMSGSALIWLSSCNSGDTQAETAAKAQEAEAARIDSLSTTLDAAADEVEENTESLKKALDEL